MAYPTGLLVDGGRASLPDHVRSGRFDELGAAIISTLGVWWWRYRTRRALQELDARLLRDVGLYRADALAESGKPFWRG